VKPDEVVSIFSVKERKPISRSDNISTVSMSCFRERAGSILARSVAESSGSSTLDMTAITSLERAAPFPPVPPELSKGPYASRSF
jgi:protein TonB